MTITLNGQDFEVREEWVCACSGGHFDLGLDGSQDDKCARKGGEWVDVLVIDGEDVGQEMDQWEAPRMVADWGWQPLGGDFYLRPGVRL